MLVLAKLPDFICLELLEKRGEGQLQELQETVAENQPGRHGAKWGDADRETILERGIGDKKALELLEVGAL